MATERKTVTGARSHDRARNRRRERELFFVAALGVGCNAIFNIEGGTLANGTGGSSGASGTSSTKGGTASQLGGAGGRGGVSSTAGKGGAAGGAAGEPAVDLGGAGGVPELGGAAGATNPPGSGGHASGGKSSAGGQTSTSGGQTTTSGGASSSGGSGSGGAPLTCTGSLTLCSAACVNIATSGENCGKCGHSCGGSECKLGVCQPAAVNVQTTPVDAVAVGASEIYFSTPASSDGITPPKLFACPKTGCTLAPRQIGSSAYYIKPLILVNDTLVFESAPQQTTERPAMYACPTTGCPGTLASFVGDGLNGFAGPLFSVGTHAFYNGGGVGLGWTTCTAGTCSAGMNLVAKGVRAVSGDATHLAFIDTSANGYRVASCDYSGGTCTAAQLIAGDHSTVHATQLYGNKFYFLLPGRDTFYEGKLDSCSLADNCASITELARGLDSPTTYPSPPQLLVDASGSYWFTATTPKLQHCAPDTCTGGATDLAGPYTTPDSLTADANFVYWVDAGTIWRVAKP